MRRAGILLTALALLAVQAPWVACACADDASFSPLLRGLFAGEGGAPCCEPDAHIAHGARHAHLCRAERTPPARQASGHDHARCRHEASGAHDESRPHCHGHAPASAPEDDAPEPSEHVAFRMPVAPLAAFAALPAPAPQLHLLALPDAAVALPSAAPLRAGDAREPPDDAAPRCVRFARLLL